LKYNKKIKEEKFKRKSLRGTEERQRGLLSNEKVSAHPSLVFREKPRFTRMGILNGTAIKEVRGFLGKLSSDE